MYGKIKYREMDAPTLTQSKAILFRHFAGAQGNDLEWLQDQDSSIQWFLLVVNNYHSFNGFSLLR